MKAAVLLLAAPFLLAGWAVQAARPQEKRASLFATWRWTSVVTKALWLGVLYVSLDVGVTKVTTVLLACVNAQLVGWPVWQVAIAIWVIAFLLFLLPPTPGVPVYMVMGIIISASALREQWSLPAAVALSTFVAYTMKMAFTAAAQRFIGVPLASSVTVRRLVGVQTVEIRALEVILQAQRVSLPKMMLLMGFPDWPVAVLCGIMRLPVLEAQINIAPVLVQAVFPCVLAGCLLYAADGDRRTQALAETSLATAALLQVSCCFLASYYVQQVIETRHAELSAPRAEDKEVIQLEEKASAQDRAFKRETAWPLLPCALKVALVVGFVLMEASLLTLVLPWRELLGARCFQEFGLTSSVEKDLGGNVFNIVRPLGWLALALFAGGALALAAFYAWAWAQVQGHANHDGEGEVEPLKV